MTESTREIAFWSVGERKLLYHETEDEAISDHLSMFALPGGSWADNTPTTVELVGWSRMRPELRPGDTLERTLEYLDEEYGDPEGGFFEATEAMKEAERAYHAAILAEYETWACEIMERKTVDVAKWIVEHPQSSGIVETVKEDDDGR